MTKKTYEWVLKMARIGNRAVRKAQEENRRLGLPNVYSRNGRAYWELPDGTLTMTPPEMFRKPQGPSRNA